MKRHYPLMSLVIGVGVILFLSAAVAGAEESPKTGVRTELHAMERTDKTSTPEKTTKVGVNNETERTAAKTAERHTRCEQRKPKIDTLMTRVVDNRENKVAKLSSIVEKVKAFYVKQGHTLANYDALVSDVNAKKTAAESAANAVKSGASFSCDGEKPAEGVQAFKQKRQSAISAVQAYRQSIKALIEGVRSVQTKPASNEGVR